MTDEDWHAMPASHRRRRDRRPDDSRPADRRPGDRHPGDPDRRRRWVVLALSAVFLVAAVVTVLKTMPHNPPVEPLSLDDLEMIVPDAAQTELLAELVRKRLAEEAAAKAAASPGAAAAPDVAAAACLAATTPHTWNDTQRANAATIVEVGLALNIPERGEVVALATAMQESQLYNSAVATDHDSVGLFQQRPSQGWGTVAQLTDPVYASTAFYRALERVSGWQSLAVTVAAQRVQKSAFPNAYAKWETDATYLDSQILCAAA